jgi:hypothetical protein
LPDRTRLQRLLVTHQDWNERFLADPSFFLVIDSYPIELLLPIREVRSPEQFGKKSKDKGRWSIGVKLCWVLNRFGQVVDWDWDTMNIPDNEFHPLIEQFRGRSIVLADYCDRYPKNGSSLDLGISLACCFNRCLVIYFWKRWKEGVFFFRRMMVMERSPFLPLPESSNSVYNYGKRCERRRARELQSACERHLK